MALLQTLNYSLIQNGKSKNIWRLCIQGTDLDDFEFPGATTEIGNYIFYNSSVKRIVIPKSVITIKDGIGYKAENLEKIEVSSNNKNYVAENYVLYNKNKTILESYPAAKTGTEFTIPSTVKK